MAKYGKITVSSRENDIDFKIRMLQGIANELAEANRLKRLELEDKWSTFDKVEGFVTKYEKELEDMA